jgi:urease accessory protein
MTAASFLAALQLSDSALPIGRFVHSHGLERWVAAGGADEPERLGELVESAVCAGVGPLDGVVVAHAHGAGSLAELTVLDRLLTARKLSPPARASSQSCGRRLAALAPALVSDDPLLAHLAGAVADRRTDGNLAVVEGALARAARLGREQAVLLALRGAAASLLSAAVRLGAASPVRAQALLATLHPAIERAADRALGLTLDDMHSSSLELETLALTHPRAEARLFAT